jgi:hypothetical protein
MFLNHYLAVLVTLALLVAVATVHIQMELLLAV